VPLVAGVLPFIPILLEHTVGSNSGKQDFSNPVPLTMRLEVGVTCTLGGSP
jgi:hypothetical protein